ncbi:MULTISPECIES: acyl carrier protein [Tenebrionibacter/Tenebrionicola group]|jgi:acyl carrier protein|uniref:Acyl carrier protein n=2 Tax=Tenebrionibacter/Tenebrionicola group TaxID=2969848 RepID=A0A8K0V5L8_9ENTR|nr:MULTISPECIES: acyl carrier protein [Tenebrionibacter/Tenebrionicola group]MBK4715843.1 acyl carrier protein [Tenebrionibacter intestinalis]MBV5096601.1 acyl carrier protein [Tenebrionicola larvae]
MSFHELVKQQISDLTDFDVNQLRNETSVAEIGLASLDFLSIQVAIKRKLDIEIDLNRLTTANVTTYGDLITFLETY